MNESPSPIRDVDHLREALDLLGLLLEAAGEEVAVAVVGGPALLLDGIIARVTRDVDVVASVDGVELSGDSRHSDVLSRYVSAAALELRLEPQ